jgi:CHAD domain-containing protein
VKPPVVLWKVRARGLEEARQAVKRGSPEGLHDLRVALRRLAVTSEALGRKRLARRARAIARSLSRSRQLQVDRRLLERIGRLGLLSPDAVTALAARWEKLAGRAARRLARATDGKRMQKLRRRLEVLARKRNGRGLRRLGKARRDAEQSLTRSLEGRDDRALHRYRVAVRRARYLSEDLAVIGLPETPEEAAREQALQEALGRWSDLRGFRRRLAESRDDAERRGTVVLAGEIERLLAALEPALDSARTGAVAASRRSARVVPMRPAARARA